MIFWLFFSDKEIDKFYKCDCKPLYKGHECQLKRDFCVENFDPCLNGATCLSVDSTLVII